MSYQGAQADIRIGRGGLMTDENMSDIPDSQLIFAENVRVADGIIQKDLGSRKWNNVALPYGIISLIDWFPSEDTQRFFAVLRNGRTYKLVDPETTVEITPDVTAPVNILISPQIQVTSITGGQENPGDTRKIFVFSGNSPIQVISGDSSIRSNIANPAVDWVVGNYPRVGIVHRNRLWAFLEHRAYASDDDDHEQFLSGGLQFPVGPGEAERIIAATVYKKRLFVFKKPGGVYVLIDDDADFVNWYFTKVSDEFGASGPDAQVTALDDLLVANSSGTITSYRAVDQQAGEVSGGDIFSLMKIEKFMQDQMSSDDLDQRRMIYHEEGKTVLFSFRSRGGILNDRTLRLDFTSSRPQAMLVSKDQVNCFCLRKTGTRKKPFYGSEDGFIYEMDRQDRNVGVSNAYEGIFQTPHTDFGYIDPGITNINKIFDFVELKFIPTGRWNVLIDYYIDGIFIETLSVEVSKGPVLDDFILDRDRLTSNAPGFVRKKLRGAGRTISFRVRNAGLNENFKITGIRVYMRPSNQNQKKDNSGRAS